MNAWTAARVRPAGSRIPIPSHSPETPMSDTQPAPLTEQQLDAIAARAGHLYEYVTVDDGDAQTALDRLAGTDTPALLAEVRRQRAELAEMRATIERLRTAYRCQPHEAAIEALRSAAERVRIGAAVGPIPLEVRPAVDAWLCRLAEQRLDRARQEARSARQGVAVSAPQPDSGHRDAPDAPGASQSRTDDSATTGAEQ